MDADQAAHHLAADAHAAHAVLFSADLFTALWPWLDRASKQALRCVNWAMRVQVDASIVAVAIPSSGLSAAQLTQALSNWPGVRDLTLLAARPAASDLQPLATASLAGLTSLTVRQARRQGDGQPPTRWGITLSSNLGATLRVLDVTGCFDLSSIDGARSCVQLRCLWMSSVGVSDLSPLAACSETLEELWMASSDVRSLAPLKACTRLRKLDLRACNPELYDQLLLGPDSEAALHAAWALGNLAFKHPQNQTAITSAGAIPALVELLGPNFWPDVQVRAAWTLGCLAENHAHNQAAIAAAPSAPGAAAGA
ncbi:hypothetical protein FOA52_010947 [Chlamydomonas sp. UWO 241]|nr:hypothetical protein FOA52_010947 [Chlamydomonas sp. UWO 241]